MCRCTEASGDANTTANHIQNKSTRHAEADGLQGSCTEIAGYRNISQGPTGAVSRASVTRRRSRGEAPNHTARIAPSPPSFSSQDRPFKQLLICQEQEQEQGLEVLHPPQANIHTACSLRSEVNSIPLRLEFVVELCLRATRVSPPCQKEGRG